MRQKNSYRFPFAAYPAVRILLLMLIGICVNRFYPLSPAILSTILTLNVCLWLVFEFFLRKQWAILSSHGAIISYLFLIVTGSTTLASLQDLENKKDVEGSEIIQLFEWDDLIIKGNIFEIGRSRSGRKIVGVEVLKTDLKQGIPWSQKYSIRLYADPELGQELTLGDVVRLQVKVYAFPEVRNPTDFNYGEWLHSQGFLAHGELQRIIVVEKNRRYGFGSLRNIIHRNIDRLFEEDEASLAKALLLGYKDDLTPETRQHFSRAGLSHIMAVSGLHVGFVIGPIWLLIPYLWGTKQGKWLGLILLTAILIFYAGLTGFRPSVSRASLMAWLLTVGRLFHKPRNTINMTAVAAIILLLIDPGQLFDAGFQLSFSAVFIILLVMPEVQHQIPRRYQYSWRGGIISIVLVSIVAQLGLFPILVTYFGEFSIIGPISNAFVVPILTLWVPAGLTTVLCYSFIPAIIERLVPPIEWTLSWIQYVASTTGGSHISFVEISELSATVFFIWLVATLLISSIRIPRMRWKMVICLFIIINIFLVEQVWKEIQPKTMRVTFLDVGQGDAIHIQTPNNKQLLIDTGRWDPDSNSGENVILPYLENHGIKRLDGVILTHPHADHIGGMVELIENIRIETIYQSTVDYESYLYNQYMQTARQKQISVKYPQENEMIEIDPAIRIFVIGPILPMETSNTNNRSLAIKIVYGEHSFLFTGDVEKEQEFRIASKYGDFLKSDLYKVAHHASNSSSTATFMKNVKPSITVASLALINRYEHPGKLAVLRLHQYSENQYYTSLEGALMFESDGVTLERVKWRDH